MSEAASVARHERPVMRHVAFAAFSLVLAGLLRFWIAAELGRLPADYADETHYTVQSRLRMAGSHDFSRGYDGLLRQFLRGKL